MEISLYSFNNKHKIEIKSNKKYSLNNRQQISLNKLIAPKLELIKVNKPLKIKLIGNTKLIQQKFTIFKMLKAKRIQVNRQKVL